MAKKRKKNSKNNVWMTFFVIVVFAIVNIYKNNLKEAGASLKKEDTPIKESIPSYLLEDIPDYNGNPYIILDDNEPHFEESDDNTVGFESYSELDSLGRARVALASVGVEMMPTEKRGSIGMVKPSGWHTIKYDIVDGKYLYNRCHLIGYQLTGENANEKNLITCTRQMNTVGMLPFENKVANYVKETNNHVLYRVTPIYDGDNLLASGVEIEAESVEDDGTGIKFHVFVYNVQDGIEIDYKTGDSKQKEGSVE